MDVIVFSHYESSVSGDPWPRLAKGAVINGVAVGAVPGGPAVLEPLDRASPSPAASGCVCRR